MLDITVIGDPKPKGSAQAYVRGGRAIITNDCKTAKPWAQAVHWTAREACTVPAFDAVVVRIDFVMPRPGRLGKKRTGVPCDKRPDIDKLARNTIDAITGVAFVDDCQVAELRVSKRYADPGEVSGARVRVWSLLATASCADTIREVS